MVFLKRVIEGFITFFLGKFLRFSANADTVALKGLSVQSELTEYGFQTDWYVTRNALVKVYSKPIPGEEESVRRLRIESFANLRALDKTLVARLGLDER